MTKPVFAYQRRLLTAPPGKTLGHAEARSSPARPGRRRRQEDALRGGRRRGRDDADRVAQLVAEADQVSGVISFARGSSGARVPAGRRAGGVRSGSALRRTRRSSRTARRAVTSLCARWIAERHSVERDRVFADERRPAGLRLLRPALRAGTAARVLVEQPTYDRPLKILRELGAETVPLAMDEEGLAPGCASRRALAARTEARVPVRSRPSRTRAAARSRPTGVRRIVEHRPRSRPATCSRTTLRARCASRARPQPSLLELEAEGAGRLHLVVLEDGGAWLRVGYFVLRPICAPSSRLHLYPPTSLPACWDRPRSRVHTARQFRLEPGTGA